MNLDGPVVESNLRKITPVDSALTHSNSFEQSVPGDIPSDLTGNIFGTGYREHTVALVEPERVGMTDDSHLRRWTNTRIDMLPQNPFVDRAGRRAVVREEYQRITFHGITGVSFGPQRR